MILIVESGSTKADWLLVDGNDTVLSFQSKGWNPLFLSSHAMISRLNSYVELAAYMSSVQELHFYSPGISHSESKDQLQSVLESHFANAKVFVESDMLAAARSVYKGKPLFVSIMGTGSNTAFYDGEIIEQFTPSLGYVLGDEGSGVALAKVLLRDYLYKRMPRELYLEFSKSYSISKELVLKSVYKEEFPNRFLASYVPFLVAYKNHPYVIGLVKNEFQNYIDFHLKSSPMIHDYSISFVGSVAYCLQDLLREVLLQENLKMETIIQSPIQGLLAYHFRDI